MAIGGSEISLKCDSGKGEVPPPEIIFSRRVTTVTRSAVVSGQHENTFKGLIDDNHRTSQRFHQSSEKK